MDLVRVAYFNVVIQTNLDYSEDDSTKKNELFIKQNYFRFLSL